MFKDKTVIILGAGASCHLDYPTGDKLIELIKNSVLNNKTDRWEEPTQHKKLSESLKEMQPLSIDMFLSYYPQFEDVGKEMIAHELLDKENVNIEPKENWYRFLVDALISGCKNPEDLLTNNKNLMIVTFNYDISLEYYLYTRLKNISFFKDVFTKFIKDLKIIHVYGQLGCYDWHYDFCEQIYDFEITKRKFDSYGNKQGLYKELSKGIEIIGIRKWNPSKIPKHIKMIHSYLSEVKKTFILGFGFYEENLEVINLNKNFFQDTNRLYYYTNYDNHQRIERKIFSRYNRYKESGIFIKSTKKIYNALSEDFEFNE